MGAGIAALCANAGLPAGAVFGYAGSKGTRNGAAAAAPEGMQGPRQPMSKDTEALAQITVGNFEDDLAKIAGHDWVVEAIIEDLAVKRDFFTRLEALRREGPIVTSNTSGIMFRTIADGLPDRLGRDIANTHFFNPVLVMKLVELIPGAQTDGEATDTLADFPGGELGKSVVFAKDTVKLYRQSDRLLLAAQRPEPGPEGV